MRAIGFIMLMLLGVGLGFVAILLANRDLGQSDRPTWAVDVDLAFSAAHVERRSLGKGWADPEAQQTWAKDREATVFVNLLGDARGDVALFMEGRSRSAGGRDNGRVTVLVNGEDMGAWQLGGGGREELAGITIPVGRVNDERPLRLTFRSERPILGLRRIVLRDVSSLSEYAGFVDVCQPTLISGWARAGLLAAPVGMRRNGAILKPIAFRNVTRPDLPPHGIPAEAGFELIVPPPSASDGATEVLFPNGRPLRNAPCRPS